MNEDILSAYADGYALPPLLIYAPFIPEQDRLSTTSRANVFLAYAAAVHQSSGYDMLRGWISSLMDWDNACVFDFSLPGCLHIMFN